MKKSEYCMENRRKTVFLRFIVLTSYTNTAFSTIFAIRFEYKNEDNQQII